MLDTVGYEPGAGIYIYDDRTEVERWDAAYGDYFESLCWGAADTYLDEFWLDLDAHAAQLGDHDQNGDPAELEDWERDELREAALEALNTHDGVLFEPDDPESGACESLSSQARRDMREAVVGRYIELRQQRKPGPLSRAPLGSNPRRIILAHVSARRGRCRRPSMRRVRRRNAARAGPDDDSESEPPRGLTTAGQRVQTEGRSHLGPGSVAAVAVASSETA